MKVSYEGRTHSRERDQRKPYGPTTQAYGLARQNFKQFRLQIGHMIKYLLTKLDRTGWENIWLSVMAHGPAALGPYAMTSSQIFSLSALPLDQKVYSTSGNTFQNK